MANRIDENTPIKEYTDKFIKSYCNTKKDSALFEKWENKEITSLDFLVEKQWVEKDDSEQSVRKKIRKVGTHVGHCCVLHGCKYGEDDCPVTTKKLPQAYECEDCTDIYEGSNFIIVTSKNVSNVYHGAYGKLIEFLGDGKWLIEFKGKTERRAEPVRFELSYLDFEKV